MTSIYRRSLLVSGASFFSLASAVPIETRAQTTPQTAAFQRFVIEQRRRTRFFLHMDFLIDTLMLQTFDINPDLQTYDDFDQLDGVGSWREETGALNQWLANFYFGELTDVLVRELESDRGQALLETAESAAEGLVANVSEALSEPSIALSDQFIEDSAQVIVTAEQIRALEIQEEPTEPYLCGFFPFSRFCR